MSELHENSGVLQAPTTLIGERLQSMMARARFVDLLLVLVVALLAGFSLHRGFDAADMVSSDALYLFQMLDTPLLEYRPPPPNRLFPDVAVHALIMPFGGDLLHQKIVAGILLFTLSAMFIGLYKGQIAFALYIAMTVSCGFGFLNSGYHYSLPLTLLLYQLARRTRLDGVVLFLVVFSDVLLLMPMAMMFVRREERRDAPRTLAMVLAAVVAGVVYSEFSEAIADFAIVLPFFCGIVAIAYRIGQLKALIVACCALMPLGAMFGLIPARYALPVSTTMLLLLFETRRPSFDWRYLAVPAIVTTIAVMTIDRGRYDRLDTAYTCLVNEIAQRGISTVAVEYWTARPLFYKATQVGTPLTITQMDFAENDSDAFMAPYSFYGKPTQWSVKNLDTCRTDDKGPKYCNQSAVEPLTRHQSVCGMFELYQYRDTVPKQYYPPPASKTESILRHLHIYVQKAGQRLQTFLG